MDFHHCVADIIKSLEENSFLYDYFEHEPVVTSEQAAAVRSEYDLCQGAKALLVKIYETKKSGQFVMFVVPGDRQFDNELVRENLRVIKTRFATREEADKITNRIEFGGVPPFGNLFGLPVYVDPLVLENERIIFNAGDRRISIGMQSSDWKKIVEPLVVRLVR
jgi:Ala-tRNA(Pro) deacylase